MDSQQGALLTGPIQPNLKKIFFPPIILVLISIFVLMKTNYLVFHILVELFSIIIVITALTVATTTSQFTKNHFIIL